MNPKISIIVPVYNLEEYVGKCIESIIHQTFNDWELILVNDGSQDNSLDVCRRYLSKDSRIRVFSQTNGGVSAARRYGFQQSSGEWILFVDGDDTIFPYALQKMYEIAINDKTDVVITSFVRNGKEKKYKRTGIIGHDEYVDLTITYKLQPSTQNRLYRRHLFGSYDFVISRNIVNNEDFLCNVILSKNIQTASIYNIPTYFVFQRPGSASRRPYSESYWIMYFSYAKNFLEGYNIDKDTIHRFILNRLLNIIRTHPEFHFNMEEDIFRCVSEEINESHLRLREKLMLYMIRNPSNTLEKIVQLHPTRILKYGRK